MACDILTQKRLQQVLNYNPETGVFTWAVCFGNARINMVAGSIKSNGYISIGVDKKRYHAHRLAWLYVYGEWPKNDIDHVNRDKTDNRIANLRVVSRSVNLVNTSRRQNNKSGYKGIWWDKNRQNWQVRISVDKQQKNLGCVKTLDEAVALRKAAEKSYYGVSEC